MTDMILSPAAIMYAAADVFAAPAHKIGLFVKVPCTEVKVDRWDLTIQLVAVSLADMMYQGLLTLQLVEGTKLFVIHTTNVVVHVTPGAAPRLPQAGLAGWLASNILAHDGGKMHDIIRAAYGTDYPDPLSIITDMAMRELMTLGYFEDETHEMQGFGAAVLKAVHVKPVLQHTAVPRCDRLATLRTPATQVQQMLQTVSSRDTHLWEILLKEIRHAIASRVEQQNDTTNF